MDLGLQGKAALICGSSQGIGLAIAKALAAEGADIAINSRSPGKLAMLSQEIAEATGVRVTAIPADLSDPNAIDDVVDAAKAALGKVDILVTNTGGPPSGPFEDHDAKVWRNAIAQNFESVVNLVREALPAMKERGWGRIINVTSISVKQPVAGLILSNSIRAGVTGFAKTIANEAGPFGVTVNNILPGFTRTERLGELATAIAGRTGATPESVYATWEEEVPMGRLADPAELGALAAFLASEQASYITGQSIAVDGGWIKGLM